MHASKFVRVHLWYMYIDVCMYTCMYAIPKKKISTSMHKNLTNTYWDLE